MAKQLFGDCRSGAEAQINDLGYEVMAVLKAACSLGEYTGNTPLPLSFTRWIFKQSDCKEPKKPMAYTVNDFCKGFLPLTTQRLQKSGFEVFFDVAKYNLVPACLSNVDCILQAVVRPRKCDSGVLGFALARRMLNESIHYE